MLKSFIDEINSTKFNFSISCIMKYIIRKVNLTVDQLNKLHKGILTGIHPTISLSLNQVTELSDYEADGSHQLPLTSLQVNLLAKSKLIGESCRLTFHPLQLKEIARDLFNEDFIVDTISMKRN